MFMKSKGLRFEFVTDLWGNKTYLIKLPSYVTTIPCRCLIANNINTWTNILVKDMIPAWDDVHYGVDLIRCGMNKTLTFYFPIDMNDSLINIFIEKLNEMFYEKWD